MKKEEVSNYLNKLLGLEIDWTALNKEELTTLHRVFGDRPGMIKAALKFEMKDRAAGGMDRISDILSEAGFGGFLKERPLLRMLSGDREPPPAEEPKKEKIESKRDVGVQTA